MQAVSAETAQPQLNDGDTQCFHCGLPVAPGTRFTLSVDERERRFCCPGCQAVCQAIIDSGLQDFYRHREGASAPSTAITPEFLQQLAVYDRPEVQSSFVRGGEDSREASLILENIRCPACLWLNERHLRCLSGVLEAEIDYTTERAWVRWDPSCITLSRILQAITEIGYIAYPYDPAHRDQLVKTQKRRSTERLLFAGLLMMPLMQFSIATYLMGQPGPGGELPLWVIIGRWTALIAAAALLLYPAQEFFLGAWRDLSRGRLGMDVPVVTGLGVAFVGSVFATVTQRHEVYFDSIAMFVLFVLLARRLELNGRMIGAAALDRLNRIVPRTALRVTVQGDAESVAVMDLRRGDRIRVEPGEILPVDGLVVDGNSRLDEAVLTGESTPTSRASGDGVTAGARNLDAPLIVEVVHASGESTVDRIQQRLRQALHSPTSHAMLAEHAARWFVHILLVIAVLTAGFWLWVNPGVALPHTVAVLIVTCPCALALAAPVAMSVGIARLANRGILPLRGDALERLGSATVVAFDKTGTLTTGEIALEQTLLTGSLGEQQALRIAAALEGTSEHPIARMFRALSVRSAVAEQVRHVPGAGVSGEVDGRRWRLGKPQFVFAGRVPEAGLQSRIDELGAAGHTLIALGHEEGVEALFVLRQQLRSGACRLMGELRRLGIEHIAILSGDSQSAVDWAARQLPLDVALGEMRPEDKTAWVQARQRQGDRVVMVGDGINDAPTLAAADASLSFAQAAELAQVGSSVLLMNEDIAGVHEAIHTARALRRVTLQNLIWAAGYNLLAVPAAVMGLVPPWAAAIGMSASSLIVVGNSLRLRRLKSARFADRPSSTAHAGQDSLLVAPAAREGRPV